MSILMILKQSHDSSPISCASQKESQIFPPTTGGAEVMCQDLKIPLLGKVPLDPHIGGRVQTLDTSIPSWKWGLPAQPRPQGGGVPGLGVAEWSRDWSGRCQGARRVLGKKQSGPWETVLRPVPPRPSPATPDSGFCSCFHHVPMVAPPLPPPSLGSFPHSRSGFRVPQGSALRESRKRQFHSWPRQCPPKAGEQLWVVDPLSPLLRQRSASGERGWRS